jgi:hypothetical protein
MIRLLNASRLPPHWLAVALLVTTQGAPLLGQSSETARAATLDVLSAHYNWITDRIKFELVNNSKRRRSPTMSPSE